MIFLSLLNSLFLIHFQEPTIPLTLGTPSKMSRDTHKQTSGSPQLDGDKQAMPPPKKSLKPRVMSSGLQKPRAGSSRLAFKPRNGPVSRIKKDGPVKPKVCTLCKYCRGTVLSPMCVFALCRLSCMEMTQR